MGDQQRTVSLAVLLYLMAMLRPSIQGNTCGSITLAPNTVQVTAVASSYASGSTMTLECATGYVQTSGTSATATCSGTGSNLDWSWGTSQLTCIAGCSPISLDPQTVQVSPAVAKGYASGSQVTLGCASGYAPDSATSTTATCSSGLTWSWGSTQLTCSIGCPAVTLNANTIQSSPAPANGYASGTTLTLACQSGYYQNTGTTNTATCVGSGANIAWEWDASLPQLTCSNGCGPITLSEGTTQVSPVNTAPFYTSGTKLVLACQSGYIQDSGTSTNATCSGSGSSIAWSWGSSSLRQLDCSPGCPAPALTSFQQRSTSSSLYAVSASVVVSCISGYSSPIGNSISITCSQALTWTPPPTDLNCQPNCLAITPSNKSSQVSPPAASSYTAGTQLTMNCSSGYIPMAGTAVNATCTNGQWTWGDGNDLQLTCFQGCNPPDVGGIVITPNTTTYAIRANITIKCATGYINTTSGRTSATCNSTGVWQWTGNGSPVTCVQTCAVPAATTTMTYVFTANTVYIIGNSITAKCATGYSNSSGSDTLTCSTGGIWTWKSPGALTCLKICTAPQTLRASLKYVSSKTATYIVGDTFTIGCNTGYVYSSGNESAVCSSTGAWIWNGGKNLSCAATCIPPVPGAFSSVTPASNQSLYLAYDVITYDCDPGYMYASGGTTGTCIAVNTWEWSNAATAPQACIVVPQNMGATSGFFASGTCDHYVQRPAVTDATCLISCLYDDYCDGYAVVGTNCYHERPQLASTMEAMSCQTRY